MLSRVFRAEEPGSGDLRKYREQMNAIDENFRIYKSNETLIDENASEIMLTEVKKMLSLVCVRINSAVYSNMRTRAQSLNKL